jgi:HAD superfamily hydrolase (TIGR01509 family)
MRVRGRVRTGLGRGASFTQLDWVRDQLVSAVGIDPHPGTLNLELEAPLPREWRADDGCRCALVPPDETFCRATAQAVRIAGRLPAAIVRPAVAGYSDRQLELVAAVPLRDALSLADGDVVSLEQVQRLPARAVIFDLDGTLVDSIEAYRTVAERAARPLGLEITLAVVREALNTNQAFWDIVLPPDRPGRAELVRKLEAEAARQWPAVLQTHGRAFAGLGATLKALRDRGARLGIVTGSAGASLQRLEDEGLLGLFAAVVTGRDVAHVKPDPEGLLRCAEALGVAPADAVYVGDTPLDVRASLAAGMGAVAVLTGAGDCAMLSAAGPHRVISCHERLLEALDLGRCR